MVTWVTCISLRHRQRLNLVHCFVLVAIVVKFVTIINFTYVGLLISIRAVAKPQKRP